MVQSDWRRSPAPCWELVFCCHLLSYRFFMALYLCSSINALNSLATNSPAARRCSNSVRVFNVLRLAVGTWRHYLAALTIAGGETKVGSLNLTQVESELAMI